MAGSSDRCNTHEQFVSLRIPRIHYTCLLTEALVTDKLGHYLLQHALRFLPPSSPFSKEPWRYTLCNQRHVPVPRYVVA